MVVSATAFTVWSQSNTNEKVYTISLLIAAAVSWLMMRWWDSRHEPRSVVLVVLAVYLMALGATNHLMSVLPAGAVLVFILLARPRLLVHSRFLSWCVAAVVVGLSFNFFLPIRAAERPVINEGDPLCDGVVETAVAIYTNGLPDAPRWPRRSGATSTRSPRSPPAWLRFRTSFSTSSSTSTGSGRGAWTRTNPRAASASPSACCSWAWEGSAYSPSGRATGRREPTS